MKQFLKTFIAVAVSMLVCAWTMNAQSSSQPRLTREQLAERQARHIADEMALDNSIVKRFVDTYCRCQKEIWALGPRTGRDTLHNEKSGAVIQAEPDIQARFDRSQKILDIRKKYYAEYSKFLTQKQINRVYELERQMMVRLARQKTGGKK